MILLKYTKQRGFVSIIKDRKRAIYIKQIMNC